MTIPVALHKPHLADAEGLLAFELANRGYFERWINARSPAYYHLEGVRAAIEDAERDRERDLSHQFLLKAGGAIVGRVNLTGVTRSHFNKATLGYRIAEDSAGKGYASRGVELVVAEAFGPLGLWRLEAISRPENRASARVLERNGFNVYGRSTRSMKFHGVWHDLLHFERCNDVGREDEPLIERA